MATDIINALKSVVSRVGKDVISKINGKNVFLATKQLTSVVKSFAWVDALSDEAVYDIIDGLSKDSVSTFNEVFKLESTMYHSVKTSTTYTGGSQMALDQIREDTHGLTCTGLKTNTMHCINVICICVKLVLFTNATTTQFH